MNPSFVATRAGWLIDCLAETLGESKRAAKRTLDARGVFVNGHRVWMARHPVRPGDRVQIVTTERPAGPAPIPVLYEKGAYLVVNKPAGMITSGAAGVEARLRAEQKDPSLSAVHRLDRDTTGCLLFARGEPARAAAVEVFRRSEVEKIYETIVLGPVSLPEKTTLRTPIDGRSAVTEVVPRTVGREASYLRIRIRTGRTHQIRKHLLGMGHPVLGDRAYGTARSLPPRLRTVPRPMLHALHLALPCPCGDGRIEAMAPLPTDFQSWLENLGLKRGDRVKRGGGT